MDGLDGVDDPAGVLVLGIGNVLMRDDGIGVHVVDALHGDPTLPPGTRVVDGGTSGLALLPIIAGARALVLVDAVELGAAPGTVRVLSGDDLFADTTHLSVHEVGAADLLAAGRLTGHLPDRVVLVGVQAGDIGTGMEPSPAVAACVPVAAAAVRTWCRRLAEQVEMEAGDA